MTNATEALKRKLFAAIDELSDEDGFVLVATADDVHFTRLKAGGWYEDRVLELEPLNAAEEAQEQKRLGSENQRLARRAKELRAEVEALEQRKAELDAAIAVALGRNEEQP